MTKRTNITRATIARAVQGAEAAGLTVARLDICAQTGKITIYTPTAAPPAQSALEIWQASRENASQRHS